MFYRVSERHVLVGRNPVADRARAPPEELAADRVERAVMPSIGEVIHDQTGLGERESQDVIYERYKTQL